MIYLDIFINTFFLIVFSGLAVSILKYYEDDTKETTEKRIFHLGFCLALMYGALRQLQLIPDAELTTYLLLGTWALGALFIVRQVKLAKSLKQAEALKPIDTADFTKLDAETVRVLEEGSKMRKERFMREKLPIIEAEYEAKRRIDVHASAHAFIASQTQAIQTLHGFKKTS